MSEILDGLGKVAAISLVCFFLLMAVFVFASLAAGKRADEENEAALRHLMRQREEARRGSADAPAD